MASQGRHVRRLVPGTLALLIISGLMVAIWQIRSSSVLDTPQWRHRRKLDEGLLNALQQLHNAVETMQSLYFDTFLGTWPKCIDWTAAVMGTYVAGSLYSLTRSADYNFMQQYNNQQVLYHFDQSSQEGRIENSIGRYFADTISYYYGQDAFSLRNQANDDMLWVVLGWLDTIRFVKEHDRKHYFPAGDRWWGTKFNAAFSHRARIFYDIASKGWDEKDCGGGMIWNPNLVPYKNAITNELFISAAVNMFLYFPGDNNTSPFTAPRDYDSDVLHFAVACKSSRCVENLDGPAGDDVQEAISKAPAHDDRYLRSAVKAYSWLQSSGMRNAQGLYIDGFHISSGPSGQSGVCDQRNTMVYTYNQGVILSAQRGLWESTGNASYLADGHQLVRNVMAATCFEVGTSVQEPRESDDSEWCGLGRAGILEDYCDSRGICSQDGQNFKGIFFHHLTLFCESLPRVPTVPGKSYTADDQLWALHRQSCEQYSAWVIKNALGALKTRDNKGRFGGWWGSSNSMTEDERGLSPRDADDYRNLGIRDKVKWGAEDQVHDRHQPDTDTEAQRLRDNIASGSQETGPGQHLLRYDMQDPNNRGRGRTVETQGAGVAVVRAMWEFAFEHFASPSLDVATTSWQELR